MAPIRSIKICQYAEKDCQLLSSAIAAVRVRARARAPPNSFSLRQRAGFNSWLYREPTFSPKASGLLELFQRLLGHGQLFASTGFAFRNLRPLVQRLSLQRTSAGFTLEQWLGHVRRPAELFLGHGRKVNASRIRKGAEVSSSAAPRSPFRAQSIVRLGMSW